MQRGNYTTQDDEIDSFAQLNAFVLTYTFNKDKICLIVLDAEITDIDGYKNAILVRLLVLLDGTLPETRLRIGSQLILLPHDAS